MGNDVGNFLSGLDTTLTSVRKVMELYDSKVAFEFNTLNFIRPDENKYSEILAYFLNPNQKHGQGRVFLDLFLKHLELDFLINKPAQITCEKGIDNLRRIDILLAFNGNEFGLGIENKIGALDQANQLKDYLKYLEKNYNQYQLLYLNPNGDNPSKDSIGKEEFSNARNDKKLRVISYQDDIIQCIQLWMQYCQSDKVRVFLSDFNQYIKCNFMGERFMKEQDIIVEQILSSEQNIKMALSIANSIWQIKKQLIPEIKEVLENIADTYNFNLEFDLENFKKGEKFKFSRKTWEYCSICFVFDSQNFNALYYGIVWKDLSCNKTEGLANKINSNLGGKRTDAWPFFKDMENPYQNWEYSIEPWIGIRNGELRRKIEGIVVDILNRLEGVDL